MVHCFTANLRVHWFTANTKLWLKRHATQPLPHTSQPTPHNPNNPTRSVTPPNHTTLTTPHAALNTEARPWLELRHRSARRGRDTKGDVRHYKHPAALLPMHTQALSWTRLHHAVVSMWRSQQTCHEALY
ncbi:hypothetical protein E2C01_061995 [Portunus trituberculatus]|uniref:Uncharacterized protein n=1 Tax=Portunus trituberculatus TaxID=210409 RepID=A0A5B7HDC5_PORTR|nr:hypothetical protein [Portunus trituberculatus]